MKFLVFVSALLLIISCKKEEAAVNNPTQDFNTSDMLNSFAINVAEPTYAGLNDYASALYTSMQAFAKDTAEANLTLCRSNWKNARKYYEQSESFLFGPVSTDNIDPKIDTWPIAYTRLDSMINSRSGFPASFVDSLPDELKGFHPIEYLLFGKNGNKKTTEFTAKELTYLVSVSLNLKTLAQQLQDSWNTQKTDNFYWQFVSAGNGSTAYKTSLSAINELISKMAGICEEVAGGKMFDPFSQKDPSLEESPFANVSLGDFQNNIQGVENVYLGKFAKDGIGLEDFVRKYNLSLDANIKSKIGIAKTSLGNITLPFGQAITQQSVQVQNAMNAISDLQQVLSKDLFNLAQQHLKN